MICVVIGFALRQHKDTGTGQLLVLSFFMLVWSIGSFVEMAVPGLEQKLLWRNITQIGTCGTPVATLVFAIYYTGLLRRIARPLSIVLYTVQTASFLLFVTDGWHHLARASITLVRGSDFETLVIQSTLLARVAISLNFIYMTATMGVLIVSLFYRNSHSTRKQILCIITGISISLAFSLIKISFSERFALVFPISGIFAVTDLCMLFGIFRLDILMLAPIARNEVFHIVGDGIVITTETGRVIDLNPAALRVFSFDAATKETCDTADVENIIRLAYPQWHRIISGRLSGRCNLTFRCDRKNRYYFCEIYPVYSRQKQIGSISVLHDITEEKQTNDLLRFRAEKDGLTSVNNRKTFIERVGETLRTHDGEVCLLFMDIDFFKSVNDNYGHLCGDDVLIAVCRLTQERLPDDAIMGRMGGEEFAVFRPSAGAAGVLAFAEELRAAIEAFSFVFEGVTTHVTVSIGVAVGRYTSFDELYRTADIRLYKAKESGRNRVIAQG